MVYRFSLVPIHYSGCKLESEAGLYWCLCLLTFCGNIRAYSSITAVKLDSSVNAMHTCAYNNRLKQPFNLSPLILLCQHLVDSVIVARDNSESPLVRRWHIKGQ